ncbi:DUF5333 domain-containing protein [Aliiroseovarius sediminis]|uniref:DUF5333 domain-containing protein n=1 Tax=Aliiroseovarius sediminis TaxID=2925839 RepID=UPI001F586E09|nr:DUF5333 domain-containing protein [Aliiroseovarius sediminis]MCI2393028.1 DUF5333 domain-containing protein [Aliiroseovarius sediminis]
MKKLRTITLASVLAMTATTGLASAQDYTALREDRRVHAELLGASVAYLIDENCTTLHLRKFRLLTKGLSLRNYAMSLGFSSKEVMAYVDSKAEQDRFRAIAQPLLEKRGVTAKDPESYCKIGRAEIKKRSFVGSLLFER